MHHIHVCRRQRAAYGQHRLPGARLARREALEHIRVVLHNLLPVRHGIDNKQLRLACQGCGLLERLPRQQGNQQVRLRHIVAHKRPLHRLGSGLLHIHHIQHHIAAHPLQPLQPDKQTLVKLDKLQALISNLAALLHIELRGGNLVHLAKAQRHHQRHHDTLRVHPLPHGCRRTLRGCGLRAPAGTRLLAARGGLGIGGCARGGGGRRCRLSLSRGGRRHTAVGQLLPLAGQPHRVPNLQEMDILLRDSLHLLQTVGTRNGIHRLPLLHDMDKIALAIHHLGPVRDLHGHAALHLRHCRRPRHHEQYHI